MAFFDQFRALLLRPRRLRAGRGRSRLVPKLQHPTRSAVEILTRPVQFVPPARARQLTLDTRVRR